MRRRSIDIFEMRLLLLLPLGWGAAVFFLKCIIKGLHGRVAYGIADKTNGKREGGEQTFSTGKAMLNKIVSHTNPKTLLKAFAGIAIKSFNVLGERCQLVVQSPEIGIEIT